MVLRCNNVAPLDEHWDVGKHYCPDAPGKKNMGTKQFRPKSLANEVAGVHVRAVVVMRV